MCYNVYGRALSACENQNCGGELWQWQWLLIAALLSLQN
jgi:hypothetical protein